MERACANVGDVSALIHTMVPTVSSALDKSCVSVLHVTLMDSMVCVLSV